MRLLHTSDWHLGRRLAEHDRLGDQAHALEQLIDLARDQAVDAIVVAGDIYDRAVPPPEACELLSGWLARVVRDLGVPVVLLAGNHDSPARLGFGAELLAPRGVHLVTQLASRARPIVVGDTAIFALPYFEPADLGDDAVRGHDEALRAALASVREARAAHPGPAVLAAHLFAAGGRESTDSERPLAVGGAGQVGVDALAGFDYVALGHLHAPQAVGGPHVRYSGSLLKYSFGEADQKKGVTIVSIAHGQVDVAELALTPRHDVVRLEASFAELLEHPRFAAAEGAYVEATYTDTGYVVDAARRLRERYPRLCAARPRALLAVQDGERPALRVGDDAALLEAFWQFAGVAGELEPAHREAYARALRGASGGEAPHLEVVP